MSTSLRGMAIGAVAVVLSAALPAAAAAADKSDVCHAIGKGRFKPLTVATSALKGHLGHGDVLQPNGAVPGNPNAVFDSACNVVSWTYAVNVAPDSTAQDGVSGNLWVGSGIPAENFATATNAAAGVELGLMVLYRQGPTVASSDNFNDGVLNVDVAGGPQSTVNGSFANHTGRAAWNYTFSIATGLGGAPTDINDFTFQLLVDVDPGPGTSYMTLQLAPGPSASGFQWFAQPSNALVINDDEGVNPTVTQNSQNYKFYETLPLLAASTYNEANGFTGPAQFDIVLQAFDGAQLIASNHIAVNVAP